MPEFLTHDTNQTQITTEVEKTDQLQHVSIHRTETQLVVQAKSVTLDIGAHSPKEGTGTFHMGDMDDPRIILPLGCRVTIDFHNWDEAEEHGWRLVNENPPFADQKSLNHQPPAFPGSEIPPTRMGNAKRTSFTADQAGHYTYFCPAPGHTHLGEYSQVDVSPA